MEPGQTLDTYISRISQDRWGALTHYAQTQYAWVDGGAGFVNSGLGVNTIKPGNWQAKKFMVHHCQHYNRQVNRLADPDVAFQSTAWRDPRRYDRVRNNHFGPPENYNTRANSELLNVMGNATTYLAGGNTPPSQIPNRAEDGESAYAATDFFNGLRSHCNKKDRRTFNHPAIGDDGFEKGATCFFIDHDSCRQSRFVPLSSFDTHGLENIIKFRFPVVPTSAMHIIHGPALTPWSDARIIKFYGNKRPLPGGEFWWTQILKEPLFGVEGDDDDKKLPATKKKPTPANKKRPPSTSTKKEPAKKEPAKKKSTTKRSTASSSAAAVAFQPPTMKKPATKKMGSSEEEVVVPDEPKRTRRTRRRGRLGDEDDKKPPANAR